MANYSKRVQELLKTYPGRVAAEKKTKKPAPLHAGPVCNCGWRNGDHEPRCAVEVAFRREM